MFSSFDSGYLFTGHSYFFCKTFLRMVCHLPEMTHEQANLFHFCLPDTIHDYLLSAGSTQEIFQL